MKNMTSIKAIIGSIVLLGALTACGDDSDGSGGGGTGGDAATTATTTTGTTTTTTVASTTTTTTTTGGDGGGGGTASGETGGGGGGEPLVFTFADNAFDEYVQIDRHGAVEAGTVGIQFEQGLFGDDLALRDEYNAATPEDDAAGTFVAEILGNVDTIHDVLDADLIDLGFTPASVADVQAQAAGVVIPDTIKYDPSLPNRYPNGRTLVDPVVDITLAAVLLKLGTDGQTIDTLVDLPLNPPANDVEFNAEFPFLAAPH